MKSAALWLLCAVAGSTAGSIMAAEIKSPERGRGRARIAGRGGRLHEAVGEPGQISL